MARKRATDDGFIARVLAGQASRLADSAVKSLAVAEELGIGAKHLVPFPLEEMNG